MNATIGRNLLIFGEVGLVEIVGGGVELEV